MSKKVTIDLSNDVITDLTIDEMNKLSTIVKASISMYKSNLKKKKPNIQNTLFGSAETISEIKTTFEKSNVSNWIIFEKEFLDVEQMGVDIAFYFNSVKDWSLQKPTVKRTAKGWLATARTFMRNDTQSKKLKMIAEMEKPTISTEAMLKYLND